MLAWQRDDPKQCIQLLQGALRAAPESADFHQRLALAHQACNEFPEALAELDRAIELAPVSREPYLHKGTILEKLGKNETAIAAYWQAWRRFPFRRQPAADGSTPLKPDSLAAHAAETIRDTQMQLIEHALQPVRERHGIGALRRVQLAAETYVGDHQPRYMDRMQRPAFIYLPELAPHAFFERDGFPWVPQLEAATDAIRSELSSVLGSEDNLIPYVQAQKGVDPYQWRELDGSKRWSAFHFFKGGVRNERNCGLCPATVEAIQRLPLPRADEHAPEALFSILKPGTHIPPHHGLGNYKLVVHLPIIIPQDCSIRVGEETRCWKQGECLIFDDSFEHEAWNRSQSLRVVLIVEVWNPLVSAAEREGLIALVNAITSFNRKYHQAS